MNMDKWRRQGINHWSEEKHESLLGKIGEVITVLNEASKISTLSTYAQEFERLRRVLLCTQDVLNYIKQVLLVDEKGRDTFIGQWMKEVRDVLHQVQELVSDVNRGGAQIDDKDQRKKVRNSLPASPLRSNNMTILQKTTKKLVDKLYGKSVSRRGGTHTNDWMLLERARGSSSHLHNESNKCFGRDDDVDTIIHNMRLELNVDHNEGVVVEPIVVSIVGIRGIGKTTLAHLIFNHERVALYFHHKVWVGRLQYDFDVNMITESIFKSTMSTTAIGFSASDSSLPHLQQASRGKRLLLVLDDVQGKVGDKWSKLKTLLPIGSCILVTTHSEEVARVMGTSYFHYLKPLREDVCWSLFAERAFWGANKDKCSELIEYSNTFMKRGEGVPLFVNLLGCYWRSIKVRRSWVDSQERTLDIMTEVYYSDIGYILEMIYKSLPLELKRCFMICSMFPKNSWIEKETVIQIWMALDSFWQRETMCSQYFDDLLLKTSFFKDLDRDDVDDSLLRCRMHPPAHDFALYHLGYEHIGSKTVGHLSLFCTKGTKSIHDILDMDRILQSLLIFGNPTNLELSFDIFNRFCFLKILDLGGTGITHLPDSLRNLYDLRHLNLSSTKITKLPKSIRYLRSLEILKLSYSRLLELPKETSLLISLRHLEIEGTCINFLPKWVGRLTNLQKLNEFIVGDQREACSIRELGNLKQLQGKLVISNLNKLASRDEAKSAKLKQKGHLNCLVLDGQEHYFNYQSRDSIEHLDSLALKLLYKMAMKFYRSKESVEMVFEGLEPNEKLKMLEIWNYNGSKFPSWMPKQTSNIVSLRLAKCGMVELLPPLGLLPSLKYLHIQEMDKITHLGREFNGEGNVAGFPKLECLIFEGMSSWVKWDLKVEKEEMSCLTKLLLYHCSVLSVLPFLPGALTELTLQDCPKLQKISSLPEVLKIFTLQQCYTLEALPNLPMSMRKLVIVDCTSLVALPQLPIGLRELVQRNCPKLEKPVQDLPKTLRELEFSNWSILGTPPQLPATLKALNISNYSESTWKSNTSLPHLEHLALACKDRSLKPLPKLPNLESLKIMMSSELASLPSELSHLKTLKTLHIHFCSKLKSLPEELQQLTNLQKLIIVGCRHLKERCQMEKGLDWHKISHVPYIKIDDKIQPNWMRIHDSFSQSPSYC